MATGLAAAGYQYGLFFSYFLYIDHDFFFSVVNLNDCWQWSRGAQGTIQTDPNTFPSGIPALADYIHSKKLKIR